MAGKEDTVEEAEAAFLAAKEGRASQETVVVTEIVSAAAVHHLVEFALLLTTTTTTTTGTKKNRRSVVRKWVDTSSFNNTWKYKTDHAKQKKTNGWFVAHL